MSDEVDEFLAHNGVKGMHWGSRKSALPGVRASTSRVAKKDATEFSKAKMFYGEGAGTRRKLIKATVEAKSAKDPSYKQAFEHHLANQDMSKRASQARGERKRKDTTHAVTKTTRSVHRIATGGIGNVTVGATAIVGAAGFAHAKGYDKVALRAGKKAYSDALNSQSFKTVKNVLKNGFG